MIALTSSTTPYLLGNFATKIWHSNACAETNRWAADTLGQVVKQRASYSEGEGSSQNWGMNMGEGRSSGSSTNYGGSQSYGRGINSGGGSSTWGSGNSQNDSDNWGRNRGGSTSSNVSHGYSEQVGYLIEPGEFGRMLKTGGPANGNRVSAIWYQAGRRFAASSGNALLAEFQQ
ncbi:MAG: hypothetical protein JO238_09475 [Alphaproteobacteria bacterium]|nr:hypothetical protein [Alphaproteobacteria bacterium]